MVVASNPGIRLVLVRASEVRVAPDGKIIVRLDCSDGSSPGLLPEQMSRHMGQVFECWNQVDAQLR